MAVTSIVIPLNDITDVVFVGCACDELGEIRTIVPSRTADPLRSILPIGSVVQVRTAITPVIITGYLAGDQIDNVRDYCGYPLARGFSDDPTRELNFDAADITNVLFLGFVDAQTQRFCAALPIACQVKGINMPFNKSKKFFGKKLKQNNIR